MLYTPSDRDELHAERYTVEYSICGIACMDTGRSSLSLPVCADLDVGDMNAVDVLRVSCNRRYAYPC
jgi:hypothetical protein